MSKISEVYNAINPLRYAHKSISSEPISSNDLLINEKRYIYDEYVISKYKSHTYPPYVNALAEVTPVVQSCNVDKIDRFVISWPIEKLIEYTQDLNNYPYDAEPDHLCSVEYNAPKEDVFVKIKKYYPDMDYLIVAMSSNGIEYFIGKNITDFNTILPYTISNIPIPESMDDSDDIKDSYEEQCYNEYIRTAKEYGLTYAMECIITDMSTRIYGRLYRSLSWYGANVMCKRVLESICSYEQNTPLVNPVVDLKERIYSSDALNDLSDIEYENFLDDMRNMNAFFGRKETAMPAELLAKIFASVSLSARDINTISGILANNLENRSYLNTFDSAKDPSTPNYSPAEIYNIISRTVINQDAAVKAASMLMYNHLRGNSRNIVMVGPTGCGKTEIWRSLAEIYPQIVIVNGPNLTPEGWKGDYKFSSVFMAANRKYVNELVVVIDEADKMFEPAFGSSGTDYSQLLQNELLKIMDHKKNNIVTFTQERKESINVDCHNISIVLCGSFERMVSLKQKSDKAHVIGFTKADTDKLAEISAYNKYTEHDLTKYGNIRAEITGRVNQIVELNTMTTADFITIINHPTASPVHQLEHEMDIKIKLNETAKEKLAELAVQSKLGCRPIRSRLIQCIDKKMFNKPDHKKYDLSKEILESMNIAPADIKPSDPETNLRQEKG